MILASMEQICPPEKEVWAFQQDPRKHAGTNASSQSDNILTCSYITCFLATAPIGCISSAGQWIATSKATKPLLKREEREQFLDPSAFGACQRLKKVLDMNYYIVNSLSFLGKTVVSIVPRVTDELDDKQFCRFDNVKFDGGDILNQEVIVSNDYFLNKLWFCFRVAMVWKSQPQLVASKNVKTLRNASIGPSFTAGK